MPCPVLNSLVGCQLAYSAVKCITGLVCTLRAPLVPCMWIIKFFQSDLTHDSLYIQQVPVFHPPFIIHWLILVFAWLTITDVRELLQHRERASVWSGVIIIYSHYNVECACVRPDPVNDSLQENVGIWLYFQLLLCNLTLSFNMKSSTW